MATIKEVADILRCSKTHAQNVIEGKVNGLRIDAIERGEFGVDVLYGDYEGGQRVVTRFGCLREDDGTWSLGAGRHWQIDRENPR